MSVHLDCDVMEPGLFATDYAVPRGLSLGELRECMLALATTEVVGVEIAEYEGAGRASARDLVEALRPVLHAD